MVRMIAGRKKREPTGRCFEIKALLLEVNDYYKGVLFATLQIILNPMRRPLYQNALFSFALLSAFACTAQPTDTEADRPAPQSSPSKVIPHEVLCYKEVSGMKLNMLILKPAKAGKNHPGFLFFHGGGWNNGDAVSKLSFLKYFAKAGFVCASVDYRLRDFPVPNGPFTPMDATRDARSALRAFVAHAEELGIDPNQIVVGGGSAGSHLACMTALGDGLGEPEEEKTPAPRVAALLLWNPVVDTTDTGYGGTKRFGNLAEHYSPVHLLHKNAPPALVQHATGDPTVPYENAQRFVATAQKLGIHCKLVTYDSDKHSFYSVREPGGAENLARSYQEAEAFLNQLHLWPTDAKKDANTANAANTTNATQPALKPSSPSATSPRLDVAAIDRDRILKAASEALKRTPVTITAFPAKLSEGGPNDFYSNGDYWWPDPTKPYGLPYIRRDGESNPENFSQHRLAIKTLRDSVAALAAAYKITGDDRYVTKAVELLRVFFLDPQTRMNPNLSYAQAIPGHSKGRGIGIIDALHLIEVPVAVQAMEQSPAFPAGVAADLRQWFRELATWMVESKNGTDEAHEKNNHAVAYYLQLAVYSAFIRDESRLAECRKQYKEVFVEKQMAPDGSFPLELARTKPYGYSIFQLDNMTTLCQVLSTAQDDLWKFELPDGRGIRKAIAYLAPYLADKSKWPLKPDIQAWDAWPTRQSCLLFGGIALNEPHYLQLWSSLRPDPSDPEVQRNIAITQPVLWLH